MANYFKSLNESFDRMFTLGKTVKRTRKLKEDVDTINPWFDRDFEDQVAAIQSFVKNYKGKKVFEDFADSIGVDVEDVIDLFADMESRGLVDIPREIQIASDYANDELYDDDYDESCDKSSSGNKPMNEDGAEDFLAELSDTIRKDVWDVVFDDVADAIEDVDNLPDYLPMTAEEAHNQFLDAVRKLAESAFIKYCVYIRDSQVDEGLEEDKKPPQNNAIDRYQRWVDFDMAHYGKISKRTQDFVNKAGYQILKDDHGDYEVAAGHFE